MRRVIGGAVLLGLVGTTGAALSQDGKRVFLKCYACHSVDPDESGLPGPNLARVVGRRAGTLPDFEYSPAMIAAGRERGLVWDEASLDAYLADPMAYVKGTRMASVGVKDAAERAAVIAYLKAAADRSGAP